MEPVGMAGGRGGGGVVGELLVDLIRLGHDAVEDFEREWGRGGCATQVRRVRRSFALLVGADLGEGALVGDGVGLDGDERGHAAHGADVAAMAGLDGELGVAAHEVSGHGDLGAVRQEDGGVAGEFLDEAEDVVQRPQLRPAEWSRSS